MGSFPSEDGHIHRVLGILVAKTDHALHLLHTLMSAISDFAAKQQAFNDAQDKAVTDITEELRVLNATIATLQASQGVITPEDQALLDQIQVHSQNVTTKLQALDTITPPAVPVSTVNPTQTVPADGSTASGVSPASAAS